MPAVAMRQVDRCHSTLTRFARPPAPRRATASRPTSGSAALTQSQFTIPLLSQHDHSQFEVFCYSNVAVPDEVTERIRSYADGWRDIAALSDEHVAEAIHRDRIDILVDLTMHMDRNRLLTFARKPAPVQVTWLAYPGTTGLTAIDYRLSDPHLDPVGTDAFYVEKTVRLPETFWCYDPLTSEPAVNALPALSTGYVTFGCLNNFAKVTDATIELWAKVLGRVGTSRLILLAPKGSARSGVLDAFSAHGIDPSRIEFVGRQPRAAYLATYRRIDLCLDTFPYNGHTTTLDSLWMGVPPITLAGATSVSRGGLSLLSNLQLRDFVAKDAFYQTMPTPPPEMCHGPDRPGGIESEPARPHASLTPHGRASIRK